MAANLMMSGGKYNSNVKQYYIESMSELTMLKEKGLPPGSVASGIKGDTAGKVWIMDSTGEWNIQPVNSGSGGSGQSGYSPTVTVKENTEDKYVLTITDVNGSYDTPNLKTITPTFTVENGDLIITYPDI